MILDLLFALLLYISIGRAVRTKQLKITEMITGGVTKTRSISLTGKGLTIALIGRGICAIILTYLGFIALLSDQLEYESLLLSHLLIVFFFVLVHGAADYVNNNADETVK